ncbi:hypothetical protein [Halobellus sp. EA9]|uniref:hypothetical protein n=1 Tax=Halobellus sp. EA9 TaxID=3421647 RepID=UPI003EB7E157
MSDEAVVLPEFATVLSHVDDAIEEGLASESLRRYLDRMGFEVDPYDPLTREVDRGRELSDAAARELRLESTERLERDAFRRSAINAD